MFHIFIGFLCTWQYWKHIEFEYMNLRQGQGSKSKMVTSQMGKLRPIYRREFSMATSLTQEDKGRCCSLLMARAMIYNCGNPVNINAVSQEGR